MSTVTVAELIALLSGNDPNAPVTCVGVAFRTRTASAPAKLWRSDVVLLRKGQDPPWDATTNARGDR